MNPLLLLDIVLAIASTAGILLLCRHCYRNGFRDGRDAGLAAKISVELSKPNNTSVTVLYEDLDSLEPYSPNPPKEDS